MTSRGLGPRSSEVTNLDKRCLTAYPVVLLVYETYVLKNGDEVVKITVNISDGD